MNTIAANENNRTPILFDRMTLIVCQSNINVPVYIFTRNEPPITNIKNKSPDIVSISRISGLLVNFVNFTASYNLRHLYDQFTPSNRSDFAFKFSLESKIIYFPRFQA